jgi:hypothetical protein
MSHTNAKPDITARPEGDVVHVVPYHRHTRGVVEMTVAMHTQTLVLQDKLLACVTGALQRIRASCCTSPPHPTLHTSDPGTLGYM